MASSSRASGRRIEGNECQIVQAIDPAWLVEIEADAIVT